MSEFLARISQYSPKRLALLADELNERMRRLEGERHGAIAIVGIGCRLPGKVSTPAQFWSLLREGADAIAEVPKDRWDIDAWYDPDPDAPGKMSTRWGGFLERVDGFDPGIFGISPREAQGMDPQQRLLLEVAWEALEDAGIPADRLEGSRTGVFIGMSAGDWFQVLRGGGVEALDAYSASGVAHSIATGRISYLLGAHGPSVAIDTACSSSLVAIHSAMQSLRRGESDMALAGGVNLILTPDVTVALSRSHMLAPDGRCKAFDASADGFVRSEGCGVLVLKRLADAQAQGDRIIAIIRGGAVNQDGRSNGLTAPNGPAQEAVLREALADADVDASAVDFVEAHGTGTSLGDPIEVQALARVLGQGRGTDSPLLVGSVKANVGHLEAAAGVTGVIKLALSLQHGEVPGQPHLRTPNPFIPWNEIPVRVAASLTRWPERGRPRVGGVSSFGFSGTNVHLVLEAPPVQAPAEGTSADRPLHILTASARDDTALRDVLSGRRDHLAGNTDALADVAFTANAGRAHLTQRATVTASTREEAIARLDALLAGTPSEGAVQGTAAVRAPRVAFLFTGQGAQSAGMAAELYRTQPVFREALDRCDALLRDHLPRPLLEVLYPPEGTASPIDETRYTQPALFAVEHALASLWMSWGVRPAAVMGHSVGELVAACIAGVLSLEDALRLVAERGRLMGALPADGAMVSVVADEARVRAAIAPYAQHLAIGAFNGPAGIVVSGLASAVERVTRDLQAAGIECFPLRVSHAFHSPLLEPMLDEFERIAAGASFRAPAIDLISNLSGVPMIGAPDARYWRRHAREPVQFAQGVGSLVGRGCNMVVEVGPHPTLIGMARLCPGTDGLRWLPSLRRGRGDWAQLLEALASLYTAGVDIDWAAFDAPFNRRKCVLPTYPFQRERFWVEAAAGPGDSPAGASLPGRELLQAATADRVFEMALGPARQPWLADHRILGSVLLPSPVHMEMALGAAAAEFGDGPLQLDDLTLHRPLPLDDRAPARVQLVLVPPVGGTAAFRIAWRDGDVGRWVTCVEGRGCRLALPAPAIDLAAVRARLPEAVDVGVYYQWLGSLGLEFGPRFRGIAALWRAEGEVLARMELPQGLAAGGGFRCHPALLDACFHAVGAALADAGRALKEAFLLLQVERIRSWGPVGRTAWAHICLADDERRDLGTRETFRADLALLDDSGNLVAEFSGLHFKRARASALMPRRLPETVRAMLHEIAWRPAASGSALPAPGQLALRAAPRLATLASRHGLDEYAGFQQGLDRLAVMWIMRALGQLGVRWTTGEVLEAGSLATRLGVLPAHHRLLERLLEILGEDGMLAPVQGGWRVASVPANADPDATAAELLEQFPDAEAELTLTCRCARELASVLRGRTDPLSLLFPGGSLADTERLYRHSPPARAYNGLIADLVGAFTGAPGGRPLRVLEIGAGTGSTTSHVIDQLPETVEYTFTDISPLFLHRAREKFAGRACMRYQLLDIGKPPAAQGFAPAGFDLILAANVLHATEDLSVTLAHVRELLAPGAILMLLEGTSPQRFGDLTVGMLDGWWAWQDTERRSYALMPRQAWLKLMAEAGLEDAQALPGDTSHPVLRQQAVLVAARPAATARTAARWLVVPDAQGNADAIGAALGAAGDSVEFLPSESSALRPALERALARGGWTGLLHVQAAGLRLDDATSTDALWAAQEQLVRSTLAIVQGLAAQAAEVPALWFVTRAAQSVLDREAADPLQATLWGLSHVVAIEHPELQCRRIDLDASVDPGSAAAALVSELHSADHEDEIAVRGGARLVRRLVRHVGTPARGAQVPLRISPDRSYLITGGFGGLGLRVAEWLADEGAHHLVLVGRRAPQPASEAVIATLRSRGVTVLVETGDVANEADLQRVLGRAAAELPALAGVIHSAGALDDGVLGSQSWGRFATVLAAKVRGSWNLHRLCSDLDFLVLFSSGASIAGSAGQANHAAANAFEDALAWRREAGGLPTVSINWGPWADIGAAAERKVSGPSFLVPIDPADGLHALAFALRRSAATGLFDPAQLAVLAADWSRLAGMAARPLFSELASAAPASAPSRATQDGTVVETANWRERLAVAAPNRRRVVLRELVRGMAAKVLGLARADQLNIDEPLRQLGLDSLMAVELRNLLGKAVGRVLPATVTFDHPSVAALVEHLATTEFAAELAVTVAQDVAEPGPGAAASLDSLSEDELAAQLLSRLDSIGSEERR